MSRTLNDAIASNFPSNILECKFAFLTFGNGSVQPGQMLHKRYSMSFYCISDKAQRFVEEEQIRLDEMVEEHGGDGGALKDCFNDKNKIAIKEVEQKIKEAKKNKTFDEDYKIWVEYVDLDKKLKEKIKLVKALAQQLDDKAKSKYKKLTLPQIKDLLINRKWHTSIYEGIYSLYTTVSQRITERIVEIAERYEQTLPNLESAVASYEKKVKKHLKEMGFVW